MIKSSGVLQINFHEAEECLLADDSYESCRKIA